MYGFHLKIGIKQGTKQGTKQAHIIKQKKGYLLNANLYNFAILNTTTWRSTSHSKSILTLIISFKISVCVTDFSAALSALAPRQ